MLNSRASLVAHESERNPRNPVEKLCHSSAAGINGLTRVGPALVAHGLSTQSKWLASGSTSLTAVAVAADLHADEYKVDAVPLCGSDYNL